MLSLNLAGGTLPSGVVLRESPTLVSLGKHTLRTNSPNYLVSSFFDVNLELSPNGGAVI